MAVDAAQLAELKPTLIRSTWLAATDMSLNPLAHTALNLSAVASNAVTYQGSIFPQNPDVAVTPGTPLTATGPALTNKQLTKATNRAVYNKWVNTQLGNVTMSDRVLPGYTQSGAAAIYKRIDTALAGLYASAGISRDAGLNNIAESDIVYLKTQFDAANAPQARRVLTVSEVQLGELCKIPRFTEADKIGNGQAIIDGAIGKVHGFNVFMDVNIVESGSQSQNLAFVAAPGAPMRGAMQEGMGETGLAPEGSPEDMGSCSICFAVAPIPAPPVVLSVTMPFGNLVISHTVTDDANELRLNTLYGVLAHRTEWLAVLKTNP